MTLYNGVRFSRIRKGRWKFYLDAPESFETDHLCLSEISWLASTFTAPMFDSYAQIKWGEKGLGLEEVLARVTPELIDPSEAEIIRQVFRAAAGRPTHMEAKERVRQAAEVYTEYYLVLERMLADARSTLP
jgi:hypothetical protein